MGEDRPPAWGYAFFGCILLYFGVAIAAGGVCAVRAQRRRARLLLLSPRVAAAIVSHRTQDYDESPSDHFVTLAIAAAGETRQQEFKVVWSPAWDAAVAAGTTEVAVDCAATPVAADNPFNAIGPPTQLPTPPPQLPAPSAGMIAPVLSAEHVAVAPQCGLLAVSCVLGLGLTAGGAALSGTLIAQQQVAADRDAGIALVVCCGLAGAGGIVAAAHLLARRRFALRL